MIEEVKLHEFLYDTRNCDYRNLPLRATVWSEIAKNLGIKDQNVVQKRWKVLREKFSVAYRKNLNDGIPSSWVFYDSLVFLEPFVSQKAESSNKNSSISADESTRTEESGKNSPVLKSPLDEHFLIRLVKERPVLYDKKHEDFRVGDSRKRAWDEISSIVNWDVDTLQKRWRVMRDRFVRELRRSKNSDGESHISCSTFFRDMLFLTHHVRSKKYEVEAHFGDSEDENSQEFEWQVEEIEPSKIDDKQDDEQGYEQYLDNDAEYEDTMIDEEIDANEIVENEEVCGGEEENYIEEMLDNTNNEETYEENDNDGETQYEAILADEVKIEKNSKRRRAVIEEKLQFRPAKIKRIAEPYQSTASEANENNDEDVAFANTIGCMLKKIPQHLKTAIKLKLLQSFADFEAQHKLG